MIVRIMMLTLVSVLLTGCREINVLTRINSDGSCEKSISVYWDSDNVREHLFPYAPDNSWNMQVKEKVKENKDLYTFTKKYSDFDSYNSEFRQNGNVSSSIEKEFRWFFTYYKFRENYKSHNELNLIPADKFFTRKELKRLQEGNDTSWVNEQSERWQQRNIFEEVFQALLKGAERMNSSKITQASLRARKEELFKRLIETEKGDLEVIIPLLNQMYNTNEGELFKSDLEIVNTDLQNKIEKMGRAEGDYKNEVTLPGIIVKTNANGLAGNKAIWTFNSDKYLITDYEMYAESRELNTMFITGSGIVVVLLIGGLTIPLIRRRK